MMPAQPTPFPTPTPVLGGMAPYASAVTRHLRGLHPWSPAVFLLEHLHELDASGPILVVDVPVMDVADRQAGPGLDVVFNLELVVATDRGAGNLDCYALADATLAFVHETRFGLGDAVDPATFVGSSRDAFGAATDNWISWRLAFRQAARLAVPSDLADNMSLIIDDRRIHEVWLGIDPKIGVAHVADYLLVAKSTEADWDAGGTS